MNTFKRKLYHFSFFVVFAAVSVAVVMWLWNWIVPSVSGLKAISYWQAAGLFALCRILFGSFGRGMHRFKGEYDGYRHKNRVHQKWMEMTDDERKEFINRRMNHFHHHPFDKRNMYGRGSGRNRTNESTEQDNQ